MKYEAAFKEYLTAVEKTLEEVLPAAAHPPADLHEAIRYAVFPGGKRFRPVLALAACEAAGGDWQQALLPGAALELVHCYSLVHDDLPALDNDEMRRGRLTCHKRYGEAMAILVGDALLTQAFGAIARMTDAGAVREFVAELSTEAGSYGMIGGQVADLTAGRQNPDMATLDFISIHKTGKLIKASAVAGAIAAKAADDVRQKITRYGERIGLAFQLVDDLHDGDGYMRVMKSRELREMTRDLLAQAKREVRGLGKRSEKLLLLADYLAERIPGGRHAAVDR